MKNLVDANDLIANIAKTIPEITPITLEDFALFQSFFAKEPHTYGNSWTYITQGMYGIGPNKLGYKYFDGKNLSAICVYPRVEKPNEMVMFWIRPMGPSVISTIADISKKIHKKYKINIYAKKLFKSQNDELLSLGFSNVSVFPWHRLYPMEDDTYPEQIYDVQKTLQLADTSKKGTKIHRSHRYYKSILHSAEITHASAFDHINDMQTVIDNFFQTNPKVASINISHPYDYYGLMIKNPKATMISELYYYQNNPISFYDIEVQTGGYASQYATLSLRNNSNHIVDYMMFDIFKTLQQNHVQWLNLGGSETESLHEFKKKFHPEQALHMYWAVLCD